MMGQLKQHIPLTVGNMMEYLPKGWSTPSDQLEAKSNVPVRVWINLSVSMVCFNKKHPITPIFSEIFRIPSFPKNGWSVRIFGEITPRISNCEGLESRNKIVSLYFSSWTFSEFSWRSMMIGCKSDANPGGSASLVAPRSLAAADSFSSFSLMNLQRSAGWHDYDCCVLLKTTGGSPHLFIYMYIDIQVSISVYLLVNDLK